MARLYSETTRTGFGGRLKGALGGMFAGLLMCVAAFPLQWWNEGRAVQQGSSLDEGAAIVLAVGSERVEPGNEGRLVHVSGTVRAPAALSDPDFGISLNALGLSRKVEMFQWRERRESKERKKLGGGSETVTEYRYELGWDDEPIDSGKFRDPGQHANPGAFPLQSRKLTADSARLGAFTLDARVVRELDDWRTFTPDAASTAAAGFRRVGSGYYRGADEASAQVGDVRVSFRQIPEGVHSFVAQQRGDGLAEYPTRAGNPIMLVETGAQAAAAMFASAHRANNMLTWMLRGAGLGLMWLGLFLVLRPLAVLFDVLPLLGTLVAKGVGFVAFVLALVLSLLTVGLAWVLFRPVLGIALLLLGAGAVFLLRRRLPPTPPVAPVALPSMPPPPPPPPSPA